MANQIEKLNAIAIASIEKFNTLTDANIEKINGREPNIATDNQDNAVNKNALCKLSFLLFSILDNKNNVPNIIVIIEALIKEESNSSNIN